MIRMLLVDDQEMIRVGLRTILETQDDMSVVGEAADGFAALQLLESLEVDVVLLDIRMPGIDGVETTRRIRERLPNTRTRILVLTTFEQDSSSSPRCGRPPTASSGYRGVHASGPVKSTVATSKVAPVSVPTTPAPVPAAAVNTPPVAPAGTTLHQVVKGDTLPKIVHQYLDQTSYMTKGELDAAIHQQNPNLAAITVKGVLKPGEYFDHPGL